MVDFDAAARRRALERIAEGELDVLVVGGGITGCGVALETSHARSAAVITTGLPALTISVISC